MIQVAKRVKSNIEKLARFVDKEEKEHLKLRQYGQLLVVLVLFVVKYPNIRVKFATFMQELQDALHHKGLLCGIALIHKISERPEEDPSFKGNLFEDWIFL